MQKVAKGLHKSAQLKQKKSGEMFMNEEKSNLGRMYARKKSRKETRMYARGVGSNQGKMNERSQ